MAEKQSPELLGASRHTRQCERPTGPDAFKGKVFICLLAGSLKTGGVLSGGANAARQKPRNGLATPRPNGAHMGAQSLFCAKKERSSLTVVVFLGGVAWGKAAAKIPRSICDLLSMERFDVTAKGGGVISPLGWLAPTTRRKKPHRNEHRPPSPQASTPHRTKRRDHHRATQPRPGNTPESEHRSTGRTRQRTTARTRRTHRSTSEAQSGHRPRQAGRDQPQLFDQRPPARAGAQRVGSSSELIYLKIQPDLAPRERGVYWESCGRDTDCSLLFLCMYVLAPGRHLRLVAAFLVLSILEVL